MKHDESIYFCHTITHELKKPHKMISTQKSL